MDVANPSIATYAMLSIARTTITRHRASWDIP